MSRLFLCLMLFVCVAAATAAPVGTAFQYQGRLEKSGADYDGNADLRFLLYDADDVLLGEVTLLAVPVTGGRFSAELDFGSVFDGSATFMEIQVQTGQDPDWTVLSPRVAILATPLALRSLDSGGAGANPWVENAGDLSYDGGTVGITGWSSPLQSGKGVFLEGGFPSHANVFAFDYDSGTPLDLILNAPGGEVAIGTVSALGKLHVTTDVASPAIYANNSTSVAATIEAHNNTSGGTSIYATAPTNGRGVDGWSVGTGWAVVGTNSSAGTFGILGTAIEGVAGVSNNASLPAGRFTNTAPGGLGLEVAGLASVRALRITGGADLAERFDASEAADPGTVMAIDPDRPGHMEICDEAFSRRVAGVVSGAGQLDAGVVLGEGLGPDQVAIALSGRVWVHCDASNGAIEPGTLLTTSSRRGHAMAAGDDARAAGAILGKAMTPLREGTGLVLVLVSLQ